MKTVLITGKGRSGTTWLAQILNTYVHCCYKHEPFLQSKRTPYADFRRDLEGMSIEELRTRFERLVRSCVHDVDQPPFPPKSVRPQDPKILTSLYRLASKVPRLKLLYETYGRPHMHEDADVLIKDVNFPNELLPRLCEVLRPHLVPIVRNPFANIASQLKGVELGHFSSADSADIARVRGLLQADSEPSRRRYLDKLEQLSVPQFEALRWRIQVEPLIAFARSYSPAYLVVYEDLCVDPHGQTEALFRFLDWRLGDSTRQFVQDSISGARDERNTERAYYTVFRDPRESMNKWRRQLSEAQQKEIASVIRDCPYLELWTDLPV